MHTPINAISQTCSLLGIKHAVICPGSRSAPLVHAFVSNSNIHCHAVVDERSAAYIALGMAQQLKKPVILICTSGTASLNFFPAIAEAYYQKVPLIVLTADRPPRLLNQQDGQMIMQKNVYGKHVLASLEMLFSRIDNSRIESTVKLVSDAIKMSSRLDGPVHINVPLEEPLYDHQDLSDQKSILDLIKKNLDRSNLIEGIPAKQVSLNLLKKAWAASSKKLIIIGQMPVNNALFSALHELEKHADVSILCDVLSNKQSVCTAPCFDFILSQSNHSALSQLEPDLVISMGGPMVSKSLKVWLKSLKPKHHFRVQTETQRIDTYNNVTSFIEMNNAQVLSGLLEGQNIKPNSYSYKNSWKQQEKIAENSINKFINNNSFCELSAVNTILKKIPVAANLHFANSSIIRYATILGKLHSSWTIDGNRGTSGIDGCTSTAVGASLINNKPTVLITGDLGFLYDRNALWNELIKNNLRIIVLNNFGGGIFQLIDGPSSHKKELPFYTTPHHQSVKNTVIDNGLDYYFCNTESGLKKTLNTFFDPSDKAAVLEITFNMNENTRAFRQLKKIKL